MPPPGKPLEVFVADGQECRQYAASSLRNAPASSSGTGVGTTVGIAGGSGHHGSSGGVGVGLSFDIPVDSDTGYGAQSHYNLAYEQCMYSKGNQVPGWPSPHYVPPPPPQR